MNRWALGALRVCGFLHAQKVPTNIEDVVETTCRFYRYEDPCDAAWFRWAVRPMAERIVAELEARR